MKKVCNFICRTLYSLALLTSKCFNRVVTSQIKKGMCVKCGKNVHISRSAFAFWNNVIIGNNVSINDNNYFLNSRAKIIIGNDVMFGPNVSLITGNHRYDIIGKTMYEVEDSQKRPEDDQDIIFEGDNWIGANACILKGVRIGEGSIIAAGAVVIHDVEPYSIVGGVPARIIKKRFSEDELKEHKEILRII